MARLSAGLKAAHHAKIIELFLAAAGALQKGRLLIYCKNKVAVIAQQYLVQIDSRSAMYRRGEQHL